MIWAIVLRALSVILSLQCEHRIEANPGWVSDTKTHSGWQKEAEAAQASAGFRVRGFGNPHKVFRTDLAPPVDRGDLVG